MSTTPLVRLNISDFKFTNSVFSIFLHHEKGTFRYDSKMLYHFCELMRKYQIIRSHFPQHWFLFYRLVAKYCMIFWILDSGSEIVVVFFVHFLLRFFPFFVQLLFGFVEQVVNGGSFVEIEIIRFFNIFRVQLLELPEGLISLSFYAPQEGFVGGRCGHLQIKWEILMQGCLAESRIKVNG